MTQLDSTSNFYRDKESSALINRNKDAYAQHKRTREHMRKTLGQEKEIQDLKSELSEIKLILSKILDRFE